MSDFEHDHTTCEDDHEPRPRVSEILRVDPGVLDDPERCDRMVQDAVRDLDGRRGAMPWAWRRQDVAYALRNVVRALRGQEIGERPYVVSTTLDWGEEDKRVHDGDQVVVSIERIRLTPAEHAANESHGHGHP